MYIGPFLDKFLSNLNKEEIHIESMIAFSPVFKATFKEEVKARLGMYGLVDFVKMSGYIVREKLNSKLFDFFNGNKCFSLGNISNKYKLPILKYDDPNGRNYKDYIKENEIDLVISIACPKILKKETIESPKLGTINYHTGALPKYRGRQPLFWAKYNREEEIGITVHEMAPALDAGLIILQRFFKNKVEESLHETYLKSIDLGPIVLLEALRKIYLKDSQRIENPKEKSTKFTFPTAEQGKEYRLKGLTFF